MRLASEQFTKAMKHEYDDHNARMRLELERLLSVHSHEHLPLA